MTWSRLFTYEFLLSLWVVSIFITALVGVYAPSYYFIGAILGGWTTFVTFLLSAARSDLV